MSAFGRIVALTVACWGAVVAQTPAKVYVFSTGDSAADTALMQALKDGGYQADLGVRTSGFDGNSVRLTDYQTVLALGSGGRMPADGITALQRYLQGSGGLILDAAAMYDLVDPSGVLLPILPATTCNSLRHTQTSYLRVDPPEAGFDDGVSSSFNLTMIPFAFSDTEICLNPASGSRILFYSQGSDETRPRPGVVVNRPGPNSRTAMLSVAVRYQQLQSGDFRKLILNAVGWAGSENATVPVVSANSAYVFRSGDGPSDTAVLQALQDRGFQANLGVRTFEFDGNSFRLTDYSTVVVLGSGGAMPAGGITALQKYLQGSGGVIMDAAAMYDLANDKSGVLLPILPATTCNSLRHFQTSYLRVDPPEPGFDDGVSNSFDLNMLPFAFSDTEICLNPVSGSRILFYSQGSDETRPRPGAVVNRPGPNSRAVMLSVAVRYQQLQSNDFRRLLANAVDWAGSSNAANPAVSSNAAYIFRTGDGPSDTAVLQALQDRGYQANLGIRTFEFDGSSVQLTNYPTVVVLGSGGAMPVGGIAAIQRYLQLSGGLILDAAAMYDLVNDKSGVLLPILPATTCNSLRHTQTSYLRVDPAEPGFDDGVSSSFNLTMIPFAFSDTELCLNPITNARTLFYSQGSDETKPRPGIVVNQPAPNSRTALFSVPIRLQELRSTDFQRLFANSVQWVGRLRAGATLSVTPPTLSFTYDSTGTIPPAQSLTIGTSDNSNLAFIASTSTTFGGSWLNAAPSTGTAPRTVSVGVNPVGLSAGTYTGEVALAATGSPVRVSVTLNVTSTAVPGCSYSLSPLSESYPTSGGNGTIGVSTTSACSWTTASGVPWVTVTSGSSGSGSGTVRYTVAANTGSAARQGAITVAGQQFMVSQPGSTLSFIVGPSPITFRFTEGSTAAAERTLYINPSASGSSFTMTSSGGTWLSVTPASGTAPGALVASVNPSGLGAGSYKGTITVGMANASPADQVVPIEVTIEPAGPPQLGIDDTAINLTATRGGHAESRKLQILNRGSGTLVFRASTSGGAWLSVQPDSGTATVASPATVVVTADPQALDAGTYTGRVVVTPASGDPVSVDVYFTVSAVSQTMLLSQAGLTFTGVAQGGAVPSQSFGVLNTADGLMQWSAVASTLAGGSWLSVSPGSGSTDAASLDVPLVDVNIDTSGLAPGEYNGLITVTSPTAANSPQLISVLLRVLPPGSDPGPVVRPTGLIFTAAAGSATSGTQEVLVSNLSAVPRTFTSNRLTYDGQSWFTHLPVDSTVLPSQPTRILVQANLASLSPGVRRGVLTMLFADGAVQTVSILSLVAGAPVTTSGKNHVSASTTCSTPALQVQPTSLRSDFTAVVGQATTIAVKVVDECGRFLDKNGLVSVRFSTGDLPINLANIGGGNWTGTWRPVKANPSTSVAISAFLFDVNTARGGQAILTGSVVDTSQIPLVTAGGIVQAASFARGVPLAPGSLVTVYGNNLASGDDSAEGLPLPTELNQVQVVLGDRPLPLLFISAGQVNVQVPYSLPVNTQHQIAIRRGAALSVPETLSVAAAQPGIFTENQSGTGQGIILRNDQSLANPDSPAAVGENIIVYCTGLGAVDNPVNEGDAAPTTPPTKTVNPVTLRIGGVEAEVISSELIPGKVGLYQVKAVVPRVPPGNAVPVQIEIAGQLSPEVTMAIH